MNNNLKIVIIGDPNKGKSSLVSTLAYDDNVKISDKSGETTVSKSFPLKINDEIIYELYDTPGFDNYEELLYFNEKHKDTYSDFNELLEAFINEYNGDIEFKKDIEIYKILIKKPIVIYLINSSESYRSEYQDQIEIIKKTKLPAFAVFNQKGNEDNKHTWKSIIKQNFIDSLSYNVLQSSFKDKIRLLELMQLKIDDTKIKNQLSNSISILKKDFERRKEFTFEELIDSFYKIITYKKEMAYKKNTREQENEYFVDIKKQEKKFYSIIEEEWGFYNLNKEINELKEIEVDSKIFVKTLGVSNNTLFLIGTSLGAGSGATIGLGVDAASFFGSLGAGTLFGTGIGAVVGGAASLWGTKLVSKKTNGVGIKKRTIYGPIEDINWRLSLLAKLYIFVELIIKRSHADRTNFKSNDLADEIFKDNKKIIQFAKEDSEKNRKNLINILYETFKRREKGGRT